MGTPMPDMMMASGGDAVDAAQCMPGDEICDGEDNDCDGKADEETDLATDIAHCGACDVRCDPVLKRIPTCVNGQCGHQ